MSELANDASDAQDDVHPSPGTAGGNGKTLEWIKVLVMPLVTVIVTIIGGCFVDSTLRERNSAESNAQLYAQLLTQRETADAQLRKDMFGVVITNFLATPKEGNWSDKVLQLELLATNFNQSLDLAPLFKDMARRLTSTGGASGSKDSELLQRLDRTAANLIYKQVSGLARRGTWKDAEVAVADVDKKIGTPWIEGSVPLRSLAPGTTDSHGKLDFSVEVVGLSLETREVEVRLHVHFPDNSADLDRHFWVGRYDFPMLDNTQLAEGLRASVVVTEFFVPQGSPAEVQANSFVRLNLVIFPASSASFKERQDFDDVVVDKLRIKSGLPVAGGVSP
ncbi:hypothetical protein [Ralstonia solanacearum]|uniref:hypothetical protein n=1 Tax=Ralstonia solanacearum TaxID=305 RepID=UPI0012D3FF3E|nr:hypothetical protein [Ralstonia solanacearum]